MKDTNIQDIEYSDIMGSNYVSYAMSVIMSRAVPDIRDGLKPVQRRIIYDMNELGTNSNKPHRKSARIVGDTMGKYHPHGDCLQGDTKILLLDNSVVSIRELFDQQKETWVWGMDIENNKVIPVRAHDFRIGQYATKIYDITFTNGYIISATANHPFLTIDGEWVKTEDLHSNMILDVSLRNKKDEVIEENDEISSDALAVIIDKYRELNYLCEPEYINLKSDLPNKFTYESYQDYRDSNLPIIESINIREVSPLPMYDFTVDKYHNMLICADNSNHMHVCAHNSSIYETMVGMSQSFKKNQPLVDGQGNFGSIEGDGAAAMRYTEARLNRFSEDTFLSDLKYDVVDMLPNYDETDIEPEVLPCKVPNLLINGAEGIAVGMTTSIPPHNLSNVIDCAITYLKGERDIVTLVNIIQGPDFPTGGIISNKHELLNIYSTGNGKIRIRGRIQLEPNRIVITEIPYTIVGEGINKLLIDISKLVEDKVLPEITDIVNQSKNEDIRIILELRPGADIKRIENILYRKTKLEDTISVNMLVINKKVPKVINLLDMLDSFNNFQKEIYTKKFQKLLNETEHKKEITEGLIKATDIIDVIIEVFKGCKNITQAKKCLITGDTTDIKFKSLEFKQLAEELEFTSDQAEAILNMQLSRLIGLEVNKLQDEYTSLVTQSEKYNNILSSEDLLTKEIITYLQHMKKVYGKDRKTSLDDIAIVDIDEIEIPEISLLALIDKFNYIHVIDKYSYNRNKQYIDENFVHIIDISNKDKLAIFTDIGKVHLVSMKDLPVKKPKDKGVPIDTICQYDYKEERIVGVYALGFKQLEKEFIFVTTQGYIKRTKNSEFFINRKITDCMILRNDEQLFKVFEYTLGGSIILESKKGLILKELQDNIKCKSRYSMGNLGIKLSDSDTIQFVTADMSEYIDIKYGKFGTTGKHKVHRLI